ncbi:MAG: carboxylating nicotinate-nucleotide diphosphorylase [Phycisphaerales bacterium]|nr:carboxylating nicotinate-nucleotide diphosphorylase [Phycisphaerales bacterium]
MQHQDLNTLSLTDLFARLAELGDLDRLLGFIRDEDLGPERLDVTSEVAVSKRATLHTRIRAREPGVVAGLAAIARIPKVFEAIAKVDLEVADGDVIGEGQTIARIEGVARDVLMVERPILNLLGRLSGVATRTARFAGAIPPGCPGKLFDTRKTTPGLRHLEKYAVRCGGGCCHRLGLNDAVLVKDNHLAAIRDEPWPLRVYEMSRTARERWPDALRFFEVEVDDLGQFTELLGLPEGAIDVILLDNMTPSHMREAVRERDRRRPGLLLEASGGITLETMAEVAGSMVDRISVGSLTHHAVSLDFGLDAD